MKKNYIVFDNKKYLYINEDVNNITYILIIILMLMLRLIMKIK